MSDQGQLHAKGRTYGKVFAALMHNTNITDGAVRLYAHMHWRFGRNKDNHEGLSNMAEMMGVSEKTISNRIKELEAHGWVVVRLMERDEHGNWRTPFYEVFEDPDDCEEFRQNYRPADGEMLRDPVAVEPRKSRKGVGGLVDPANRHRQNSGSAGGQNSDSAGGQNLDSADGQNLDSDNLDSFDPDKSDPEKAAAALNIFALYEALGFTISPLVADELKDMEQEWPAAWIEEAFREGARSRAKSLKYIIAILERWQREGKPEQVTPAASEDAPVVISVTPDMADLDAKLGIGGPHAQSARRNWK